MRKSIYIISLLMAWMGEAQNFEQLISNGADVVTTVNGDKMVALLTQATLENSIEPKRMIQPLAKTQDVGFEKSTRELERVSTDKSFNKYYNHTTALGYVSLSINSQAMFAAYPKAAIATDAPMLPSYKEELELLSALTSIALNEEGLAELLTGDALLILNDIVEKEIEYTSYQYDEEHEREEVKGIIKEAIPEFTIMIGSEKEAFLNKSIRLGEKYETIADYPEAYKIELSSQAFPFDLYITTKNNILFLTSSKTILQAIGNDTFIAESDMHMK